MNSWRKEVKHIILQSQQNEAKFWYEKQIVLALLDKIFSNQE